MISHVVFNVVVICSYVIQKRNRDASYSKELTVMLLILQYFAAGLHEHTFLRLVFDSERLLVRPQVDLGPPTL